MEKEKKNNNIGVIAILAVALIAVLAFGIWAWSKYTTTLNGNGTATVAKWKFGTNTTINGIDLATASNTAGNGVAFDTVNNVKADRIAPGTKGSFTVLLDTSGTEVALKYDIILSNITNKPTNLHFYSDAGCTKSIEDKTDPKKASVSGNISQEDAEKTATKAVTIYWKWDYETGTTTEEKTANDERDTADGEKVANKVTFDLTIKGTQINPKDANATTDTNVTVK